MSTEALQWFKSTYSGDEGGECLEVAYAWRKSSRSSDEGGECVEIATCPHTVHVRDSKNPDSTGPTLHLTPTAWAAFIATA
ncbi:DUF397 domain-containing protein [Streptomyces sp. NPDC046909]|uniref:DUF397 domain-containing protein n=1 Tax=Streptomyces sp. NPDC046909 TaxID=3155617 RepID=UPI0033C84A10